MIKANKKYFLIPILATTSFAATNQVVNDEIKLVTSPEELISKDIIRSEIINDYEFKLKLKNLEKATKQQELELKKLLLENKKIELTATKLNNEELKTKLEREKIGFEIKKQYKKEELFEKYPYTFLNFIPKKIDLLNNIIKGKIEKTKLDNLDVLKEINLENINILKKQYSILADLNTKTNEFYIHLVNYNINGMKINLQDINKVIEELFNTNILYIKDKFIKLSKIFTRIKTLTNSFVVDARTDTQKAQKEYQEINELYQDFEKTLLEIKEEVLKKLIELKQTNNLKIVDNKIKINEEQYKPSIGNFNISGENKTDDIGTLKNLLNDLNKNKAENKVVLKRKKSVPSIRFSNVLNDPRSLEYARKQLAIEMGVPVAYLSYLTPKDIYEIQTAANKANLLKTILLKLEVDKELTEDEIKVLQEIFKDKTINGKSNKLYLKYKVIDKINNLLKKKYLILQKSIEKYKNEIRKRQLEQERLKKLELERARIEAEKKAKLAEIERKRRLEELRRKRELERKRKIEEEKRRKKLEKERKIQKIKQHINEVFSKYAFIGIINNSISLQNNVTGEIIYIHPGSVIKGIKILKIVDYNQGIIKVSYKGIEENINLSNPQGTGDVPMTGNGGFGGSGF